MPPACWRAENLPGNKEQLPCNFMKRRLSISRPDHVTCTMFETGGQAEAIL